MGPHVVRFLSERGHKVAVFHRGKSKARLPEGTIEILGDRGNISKYTKELEAFSPQVVIDMICLNEKDIISLCDVAAPIAERLVLISSCDVYSAYGKLIGKEDGAVDPHPLTEESPLRKVRFPYRRKTSDGTYLDDYDKIPAEEYLMSHSTLKGTVLRLPMVFGPGDEQHRLLPYVKRADDGRKFFISGELQAQWKTARAYVENVAWAITLAAIDERAAGRIYNVSDSLDYTEAEWVSLVTKACGAESTIITASDNDLPEGLRAHVNFAHHLMTSSKRIRDELGYSEKVMLSDALKKTIEWERDAPAELCTTEHFNYEEEDLFLHKLKG